MARELQPCGTVAAYKRHLRRGEEPCGECLAAKRSDQSKKRAVARVPDCPVPVPEVEPEGVGIEAELRWQADTLRNAIEWAAEKDPGKLPALAKERRETLAKIAELSGESTSEGGALGDFLSGPTGLVRFSETETRARA